MVSRNRRMSVVSRAALLLTLLLSALMLSACNEEQPQEPEVVRVAFTYAEAVWEFYGPPANMALEDYNARGGAVPIEFVQFPTGTEDDPYGLFSTDQEVAAVQQAIDDPQVLIVIGGATDTMVQAGVPVANEAGLAYLSSGSSWAGLTMPGYGPGEPGIYYPTGERNFFRTFSRDDLSVVLTADFILDEFAPETIYIVNTTATQGRGTAGQMELAMGDAGVDVIAAEALDEETATAEEITALAGRIIAAEPDVLYVGSLAANETVIMLYYEIRAGLPDLLIVGQGIETVPLFDPPAGHTYSELDGIYGQDTMPHPSRIGTEAADAFVTDFEARFGPFTPGLEGKQANTYEQVSAVLYAIEHADELTRAGVLAAMRNLRYTGIYGVEWGFTPEGDRTLLMSVFNQLEDGVWVPTTVILESMEE